eukprot:4562633-Prymnesium_polylepis.1
MSSHSIPPLSAGGLLPRMAPARAQRAPSSAHAAGQSPGRASTAATGAARRTVVPLSRPTAPRPHSRATRVGAARARSGPRQGARASERAAAHQAQLGGGPPLHSPL